MNQNQSLQLMLLTFGPNIKNHYQACFCILSFLKDPLKPAVTVYTDRPEFYRCFEGQVDLVVVDQVQLQAWRGEADFFWRIKCKAVEDMVLRHPGQHIMYVDSDTFLGGGLQDVIQHLDQGQTLMHLNEGKLAQLDTKTTRNMWQVLAGSCHEGITIDKGSAMWNAGVVALPGPIASAVAEHTVAVCDSLCATKAPRKLLEQFAFSLALNHAVALQPADTWIGHYWGNKEQWNAAIAEFYLHSKLYNRNLQEDIAAASEFAYDSIALHCRVSSSNRRLKGLAETLFPNKVHQYFKH
ncbi:hypothetical protein [Gilvimarinus sp. DA14]|uniref:hypothetical protein n=1 Tax=Gilvimarinus sp. DA14 TaxID=2956798 RepID=UPI0020B8971D|nr:hypothetical protein [Gilvimarinus sp. DA14]UTF61606.1 hypothetical protein NHM04_07405 [Gilvimarinus sp. DA14]